MRFENFSLVTAGKINKKDENQWISLRTVPVILSLANQAIKFNTLLDGASNLSYVSEKIVRELRMNGPVSVLTVALKTLHQEEPPNHCTIENEHSSVLVTDKSRIFGLRLENENKKSMLSNIKIIYQQEISRGS